MIRTRSNHVLLGAVLLLAVADRATAQEFRATVKGQIVDASHGALPGATVSVQNAETNEVATATTNAEGNYTIPFLRPGLYTLTVELSGFQKHVRSGLRLQVSQTATINVQLGIGAQSLQKLDAKGNGRVLPRRQPARPVATDTVQLCDLFQSADEHLD